MKKSRVIAGILIGAAAGAAIYTLFATKKGKSFRKMVAHKSSDLSDTLISKFNELGEAMMHKGKDAIKKGKQVASEKMHDPKYAM